MKQLLQGHRSLHAAAAAAAAAPRATTKRNARDFATRSATVSGESTVSQALEGVDTCIFDCDGVLWKGSRKIEGADEAIRSLEAKGKRTFYLTNNSAKSREQCGEKLASVAGITARKEQIICSSSSAASYLESIGFDKGGKSKVLVIGQEGILLELKEAGYTTVKCEDILADSQARCSISEYEEVVVDESIRAVVAGVDDSFTYRKLCLASLYLQKDPQRIFVATNLDVGDSVGMDGRLIPGAGPIIASIESACGRKAVNVGKGGDWLLPFLLEKFSLEAEKTCIVGDRLDTDIALGKESGMLTILPLTGVTREDQLHECPEDVCPDLVVESIATLI